MNLAATKMKAPIWGDHSSVIVRMVKYENKLR